MYFALATHSKSKVTLVKVKCKATPLQAWTGPEGSRRLNLPHFKTIGTWKWYGCHPYAPSAFSPRNYSWYSFPLEAESTPQPYCGRKYYINEKFQWSHRELDPRPSGLWHSASTNCAASCPKVTLVSSEFLPCSSSNLVSCDNVCSVFKRRRSWRSIQTENLMEIWRLKISDPAVVSVSRQPACLWLIEMQVSE
jgi:hypothetical protein